MFDRFQIRDDFIEFAELNLHAQAERHDFVFGDERATRLQHLVDGVQGSDRIEAVDEFADFFCGGQIVGREEAHAARPCVRLTSE